MANSENLVIVGRSSSHFTRTTRIFAHELGVAHEFRPVVDMTTLDPRVYAENPALKVPILIDAEGPLYGTENICRALTRRSASASAVLASLRPSMALWNSGQNASLTRLSLPSRQLPHILSVYSTWVFST